MQVGPSLGRYATGCHMAEKYGTRVPYITLQLAARHILILQARTVQNRHHFKSTLGDI
jgi:hypothetical protein